MANLFKPLILLTVVVFAAVFSVSAQASSVTGEAPLRGEGAAAISGYTITSLQFQLGNDPLAMDAVEFDLDAPAREVQVSFDAVPGRAFRCVNVSGNHWSCALDQVHLGEVEQIHISASS